MNDADRLGARGNSGVRNDADRGLRDKEGHGPGGGGSGVSVRCIGVDGSAGRPQAHHGSKPTFGRDQEESAGSGDRLFVPEVVRENARGIDTDGGEYDKFGPHAISKAAPRAVLDTGDVDHDDEGGYSDDSFALDSEEVGKSRALDERGFVSGSAGGVSGMGFDGHDADIEHGCTAVDAIPSLLVETGRGAV